MQVLSQREGEREEKRKEKRDFIDGKDGKDVPGKQVVENDAGDTRILHSHD